MEGERSVEASRRGRLTPSRRRVGIRRGGEGSKVLVRVIRRYWKRRVEGQRRTRLEALELGSEMLARSWRRRVESLRTATLLPKEWRRGKMLEWRLRRLVGRDGRQARRRRIGVLRVCERARQHAMIGGRSETTHR